MILFFCFLLSYLNPKPYSYARNFIKIERFEFLGLGIRVGYYGFSLVYGVVLIFYGVGHGSKVWFSSWGFWYFGEFRVEV